MKTCRPFARFVFVVTVHLALPGHIGAEQRPAVGVEAREAIRADGTRLCVIGTTNLSGGTLADLRVQLFDHGRLSFTTSAIDLEPAQAIAVEQAIGESGKCSGPDVFFRVTYKRQGMKNDALIASTLARGSMPSASIWAQILPWLLGLVSALLGGWFTHWLTLAREREKDRASFRAKYYEGAQPAFRDFLSAWGASQVPEALQAHFVDLQSRLIVDPRIIDLYRGTYAVLADGAAPGARKREAAEQLDRQMRSYIHEFDPCK